MEGGRARERQREEEIGGDGNKEEERKLSHIEYKYECLCVQRCVMRVASENIHHTTNCDN